MCKCVRVLFIHLNKNEELRNSDRCVSYGASIVKQGGKLVIFLWPCCDYRELIIYKEIIKDVIASSCFVGWPK